MEDRESVDEDVDLLAKGKGFLEAGQLYMFYPQEYYSRLTLCRTRSTDEPGVYIKRRAALAVMERIGTWRNVYCSGFNGWINVSDDQEGSKVFVPAPSLRRYQDWKGNNYFLFGGKVMLGSDVKLFLFTNFMTLMVTYAFFAHLGPAAPHHFMVEVVGGVLLASAVINLWITAFMDPGIVPRNPPHLQARTADPITEPGWKYCTICNILRAPEVKHCSVCQNCVQGFDHHCPYTFTCIGARNRKYFVRFVVAMTATVIYMCVVGITVLALSVRAQETGSHMRDVEQALVSNGVVTVVTMSGLASLFLFIPFCHYHLFIVAVGETTFQRVKHMYATTKNPHDRGVCGNYSHLCCGSGPESLLPDLAEEVSYESFLRENMEAAKFEKLFYQKHSSTYGAVVGSMAGTEVV